MDREAWHAAVHGVAKSQILRDWTELNCVPRIVPDMVGNHCTQQIEKAASRVLKTSYHLFKWILKNIFKDKGYGFH